MPEIPEMELYKDHLTKWVKDRLICGVNILRAKSINLEGTDFKQNLIGKRIKEIARWGKYIVFHLDDGHFLLTHMMLDGRLFLQSISAEVLPELMTADAENLRQTLEKLPGKPSVVFNLANESLLFFCNLTLGYLHYLNKAELESKLRELGRDPLDPNFESQDFVDLLKGKKGMIKPWLMNPKHVAGVGNAYSNEALFGAGILPTRQISSLADQDKARLFAELRNVLRNSIRLGGDMEEPFASWDDFTGGFNSYFKVYDRAGEPCLVCKQAIEKSEVGGRNAFFCPHCQR